MNEALSLISWVRDERRNPWLFLWCHPQARLYISCPTSGKYLTWNRKLSFYFFLVCNHRRSLAGPPAWLYTFFLTEPTKPWNVVRVCPNLWRLRRNVKCVCPRRRTSVHVPMLVKRVCVCAYAAVHVSPLLFLWAHKHRGVFPPGLQLSRLWALAAVGGT